MTALNQVFKCVRCGNIIEVVHPGVGRLACCGQEMAPFSEKDSDVGKEKHVPIITNNNGIINVKVSSVPHPMEEMHYIEWIEIIADDHAYKKFMKPGEEPEAEFALNAKAVKARAYCNVHGLWKSA